MGSFEIAWPLNRLGPHPLDVAAVSGRAGQAQPDHIHEQTRDPQQVHGVPDERRCDDVVDKERSVIRQKDAPETHTGAQNVNKISQSAGTAGRNTTHSNLTVPSARNLLSKSQRKKTSRLKKREGGGVSEDSRLWTRGGKRVTTTITC